MTPEVRSSRRQRRGGRSSDIWDDGGKGSWRATNPDAAKTYGRGMENWQRTWQKKGKNFFGEKIKAKTIKEQRQGN